MQSRKSYQLLFTPISFLLKAFKIIISLKRLIIKLSLPKFISINQLIIESFLSKSSLKQRVIIIIILLLIKSSLSKFIIITLLIIAIIIKSHRNQRLLLH